VAATLQAQLHSIRALKSKGATHEVEAMYRILELEKQTVLWRRDGVKNFSELLRIEAGVCSINRHRAFKKADGFFNRATIDKLGVPAVCLLAVQNQATRDRLLKYGLEYQKKHGVEPTYQYFSRFLRKPGNPVTRTRLNNYVELLKKTIRELGGRVPPME
jgi:hypothetical protein